MSTRPDNQLVTIISRWLARHVSDAELRHRIGEVGVDGLAPEQREAVEELAAKLGQEDGRGELEMLARETLEALALGG